MILKANSNKIRGLRQAAKEAGIQFVDFTDTMTTGTFIEQLERTKQTKDEALVYYGIVLFGDWEKISELTRKFSLWK
jgi:predicted metal-dependent phosphoesterase TrpH